MRRAGRLLAGMLLALAAIGGAARAETRILKDIVGRNVTLPRAAQRIVLAEGRQLFALSLIHPDPVSLVAGWLGDLRRNDSSTYALFRRKFPAIDAIPLVGAGTETAISAERIIGLKPDLVVLGIAVVPGGASSDIARQLDAAGIPFVFTDFFIDPFVNTLPSMRILGEAIGREREAEAFAAFYRQHMAAIASRLNGRSPQPTLLVEAHAGMSGCCFSPGRGNIGRFIAFAGGRSIAADVLPGPTGQLNMEYVIAKDPEVYIATGGPHLEKSGGLVIGPGYDEAAIRGRLAELTRRPGFANLSAVRQGRVHGLFHNLLTTPLNFLATELIGKWLYPAEFQDADPARTKAELNARFLAVPLQGTYWVNLNE